MIVSLDVRMILRFSKQNEQIDLGRIKHLIMNVYFICFNSRTYEQKKTLIEGNYSLHQVFRLALLYNHRA